MQRIFAAFLATLFSTICAAQAPPPSAATSGYVLVAGGRIYYEECGAGTAIPGFIDQTHSPNFQIGGFGFFDNNKYDRDVAKLGLTKYFSSHEFKIGGDYEKMKADVQNYQGGAGQRIYKRVRGGVIYYRHRYYVNDLASGFSRTNPATWQILNPLVATPETANPGGMATSKG